MNIIFGDSREALPDNYTILELDQFRIGESGQVVTAYCLLENIPLGDFPTLDAYIKVHHDLITEYRKQNWEYCLNATKGLTGYWNGELDTFYSDLQERVKQYSSMSDPNWSWIIKK
jgi:hypothetical protein